MNDKNPVSPALRAAFVLHCIIDCIFAIPLFFFPQTFLTLLGWQAIDPVSSRLVAAALFGIGIESFLGRNAGIEAFKGMLNLKIIWSFAAFTGLAWSLAAGDQGKTFWLWILILIFAAFNGMWLYWRIRLTRN
jgi:hypothetical protein